MIVRFFALFKRINSLKFGFFRVIIYTVKNEWSTESGRADNKYGKIRELP